MKNIKKLTFVAITALYATTSIADTNLGSSELGIFGNISSGNNTTAVVSMTYGKYMSSKLLWSVGLGAFGSDAAGSSILINGSTGITYHFNEIGSTSYIKSNLFIGDLGNAGDTTAVEAYFGFKNYVNDKTAIFYEIGYRTFIDSGPKDQVIGNLGLTYLF